MNFTLFCLFQTLIDSMSFNLSTVGEFFCILYLIKFKRRKIVALGSHPPQRVKLGSLTLCIVVKRQRNIQPRSQGSFLPALWRAGRREPCERG